MSRITSHIVNNNKKWHFTNLISNHRNRRRDQRALHTFINPITTTTKLDPVSSTIVVAPYLQSRDFSKCSCQMAAISSFAHQNVENHGLSADRGQAQHHYSDTFAAPTTQADRNTMMESSHRRYHQPVMTGDAQEDAIDIALSAIDAVRPNEMIEKAIKVEDGKLIVEGKSYPLRHNVYVAAFGKAVLGMIKAVESVVGDHIVGGVASVPYGLRDTLEKNDLEGLIPSRDSKVEIFGGARYNLPDQDCVDTSKKICELAKRLTHGDILLVLISGGGSALFTVPQPPITLDDVIKVTKALSAKGATITQLNIIRRHLSLVKGGRFAQMASPAKVVSLILSDVLGDPLDSIASGPTVPELTTAQCCIDVITSFKLADQQGEIKQTVDKVIRFLQQKKAKDTAAGDERRNYGVQFRNPMEETLEKFSHVQNVIVGTNKMVAEQAVERAESLGYRTVCITTNLDGVARERGIDLANMALYACSLLTRHGNNEPNKSLVRLELDLVARGLSKVVLSNQVSRVAAAAYNSGGGICIVAAGETIVELKGEGKGGRNQELALAAGVALHRMAIGNLILNRYDVKILSIGTDGQDGPCDAAGAIADSQLIKESGLSVEDALRHLDNNDSYTFFENTSNGAYHIMTGMTGTNVMDLHLILIKEKPNTSSPTLGESLAARREFDQTFE